MNFLETIVWNADQRRVRCLWRILLQTLLFIISLLLFSAVFLATFFLDWIDDTIVMAGVGVVSLLATFLSMAVAGKFLDRRPWADFGFHFDAAWWRDLGFGMALGALLMAGIFAVEYAAGWITITGTLRTPPGAGGFVPYLLLQIVLFLCVGIYEEALFRGYYTLNLAEGLHTPLQKPRLALLLAWIATSLVFGLAHAGNPNATAISTLNIALAGILLGLGYVLTGELAIPIGLHITWNFFQGNVFGFPVSGMSTGVTFIDIQQGGPTLWTGGAFGPEAGLIGLAAMALGIALTLVWIRGCYGRIAWATDLARYDAPVRAEAPPALLDNSALDNSAT